MKRLILFLLLFPLLYYNDTTAFSFHKPPKKFSSPPKTNPGSFCENLIPITFNNHAVDIYYLPELYKLGLDTLPQVLFWKKVIQSSDDTIFFSCYPGRKILHTCPQNFWKSLSDEQRKMAKDSLLKFHKLDSASRMLITSGKNYFYNFNKSVPIIEKGLYEFYMNDVDPWYAQAILLIESPNKLQKSNAGAYGPFQLMKKVARMYGLKVDRTVDERADFSRSAYAASQLIKEICIPKAREICDFLGFCAYNETDLWFRLLVMHIYHAGFGNVLKVIKKIENPQSDISLITKLWNTESGAFGNASQNYSQLILATHLVLYDKTGISKIF